MDTSQNNMSESILSNPILLFFVFFFQVCKERGEEEDLQWTDKSPENRTFILDQHSSLKWAEVTADPTSDCYWHKLMLRSHHNSHIFSGVIICKVKRECQYVRWAMAMQGEKVTIICEVKGKEQSFYSSWQHFIRLL